MSNTVSPSNVNVDFTSGSDNYENSKKQLLDKVGKLEINVGTIMTVVRFAMEVVEATQIKGPAQRKLCIELVKDVVIAAPLSGEKEKLILDMINSGVLDNTIELVVDATKGDLDINAAVGVAKGCFSAISKNFC